MTRYKSAPSPHRTPLKPWNLITSRHSAAWKSAIVFPFNFPGEISLGGRLADLMHAITHNYVC